MSVLNNLQIKLSQFRIVACRDPDVITVGKATYLKLCSEINEKNKRTQNKPEYAIKSYMGIPIMVLQSVDIMIDFGMEGWTTWEIPPLISNL